MLSAAAQHGRTGVLKVILEDTNVLLSVKDKEYVLAIKKPPNGGFFIYLRM